MIEYANEFVIKLLKQYDMLSKSLNFTTDLTQNKEICNQMTKIIQNVLEQTNIIYEEKYKKVSKCSVYLMDEEKTRLLELIKLINERRAYINNQITNNEELTGISIDYEPILGEDKLEEYKEQVKIIDKYKNNIKLENVLKDEIKSLEVNIKKANDKINNNKHLNKQLEEKMIRIVDEALTKLSLYELTEREKEIDLAYTQLGYSLEKAKENAKVARRDFSEEIINECDNMLASITLEYERYKEKKLILKLIYIYKEQVNNYEELLNKREEINNILINITSSELYSMIGSELNKEYATVKLEAQDLATLKSLVEEKELKQNTLKEIDNENNSEKFKGLLSILLENEKRHQEKLLLEKKRKEQERIEREKEEEKRKLEEIAKRQKALEEERKKEIERRTKQLLVEKKNPVLMPTKDEKSDNKEELPITRIEKQELKIKEQEPIQFTKRTETREEKNKDLKEKLIKKEEQDDIFSKRLLRRDNDFFSRELKNNNVVNEGIPVIKNNNLDSKVVTAKKTKEIDNKIFPEIPLEKKEDIFPNFPEMGKSTSFFDENEFDDLSNYLEDDKKKSWF